MKKVFIHLDNELARKLSMFRPDGAFAALKKDFEEHKVKYEVLNEQPNSILFTISINNENDEVADIIRHAMGVNEENLSLINISVVNYESFDAVKFREMQESNHGFVDFIAQLNALKQELLNNVLGQSHAINKIVNGLLDRFVFVSRNRKVQTFVLAGPHGVGKSYVTARISKFFDENFRIPSIHLSKKDYEDTQIAFKITSFVAHNPNSIVVFHDAEEFYAHVSAFVNEVLMSSKFADVPFNNVIFMFTTCMGSSIYNDSFAKDFSEVSNDQIINALMSEHAEGANVGSFHMQVANNLRNGICVMFNFLDMGSLYLILRGETKARLDEFTETTGIKIKCDLNKIATSIFYLNNNKFNVMSLRNKLDEFVKNEINDIAYQINYKTNKPLLYGIQNLVFNFDFSTASENVTKLFEDRDLTCLVVANKKDQEKITSFNIPHIKFVFASSVEDAKQQIRGKIDFILIDVAYDLEKASNVTSAEDLDNGGMELFRYFSSYFTKIPLYVIRFPGRDVCKMDYQSLLLKGATDLFDILEDKPEMFEGYIRYVEKNIELTNDVQELVRTKKILSYNSVQNVSEDGKTLNITFGSLSLKYAKHNIENGILTLNVDEDLTYDNFVGNKYALSVAQQIGSYLIDPINYLKEHGRKPICYLIQGSNGIGKGTLVKTIANETGASLFYEKAADIYVKCQGNLPNIVEYFKDLCIKAKRTSPSIICVKDFEQFSSFAGNEVLRTFTAAICREIAALEHDDDHHITFIGLTSAPKEAFDPELLNICNDFIIMNDPLFDERKAFLVKLLSKHSIKVSEKTIISMAHRLAYCSFKDVEHFIDYILKAANNKEITDEMILDGFDSFTYGNSDVFESSIVTAYHEMGHFLVGYLTGDHPPYVTVMKRGYFLGYTLGDAHEGRESSTKQDYLDRIAVCVAGRAAEKLLFGEDGINSGASQDYRNATAFARIMVNFLGMGENRVYIDYMNPNQDIPQSVYDEINTIIKSQEVRALELLKNNKDAFVKVSKVLQKRKFLTGQEVEELFEKFKKEGSKKVTKKPSKKSAKK